MDIYDPIAEALGLNPLSRAIVDTLPDDAWSSSNGYDLTGKTQDSDHRANIKAGLNRPETVAIRRQAAKDQWARGEGVLDHDKIRAAQQEKYGVENIRQLQTTCPHCGKIGQEIAFRRWHGDNCRAQAGKAIQASTKPARQAVRPRNSMTKVALPAV